MHASQTASGSWPAVLAIAVVLLSHMGGALLLARWAGLHTLGARLVGAAWARARDARAAAARARDANDAPPRDAGAAGAEPAASVARKHERIRRPAGPLRAPAPLSTDRSHTDVLALDCEMVGTGFRGLDSMLASVCVVNAAGNVLYASLVRPQRAVTDYRTQYSGVTAEMLAGPDAREFDEVRAAVKALLDGRIVVGHSVDNDFVALAIDHPAALTRDTAHDLRRFKEGRRPKRLRVLAADVLGLRIQRDQAGHDPAEDARASLYLYLAFRGEFEEAAARRNKRSQWLVRCRAYEPDVDEPN